MVPDVGVQLNVGIMMMMMMMAVLKITVMKIDGALSVSSPPPIFSSNPFLKLFTTLSRYH